jgi:hypothetical protein
VRNLAAFHGNVGGRVDRVARSHQPLHGCFGIIHQQRAIVLLQHAPHQQGQLCLEPDRDAGAADVLARLRNNEGAPAGGQHLRPGGEEAGDYPALAVPEVGLAVILEDVRDGLAGGPLDLLVGIDERHAKARCQAAADRGLAAAGHADQDDRPFSQRGNQLARRLGTGLVLFASLTESHHHIPDRRPDRRHAVPRRPSRAPAFCVWPAASWRNMQCSRSGPFGQGRLCRPAPAGS